MKWTTLKPGSMIGPWRFEEDGTYAIAGGLSFSQNTELGNCQFGNMAVNKPSGEGEILCIKVELRKFLVLKKRLEYRLKYEDGKWHIKL